MPHLTAGDVARVCGGRLRGEASAAAQAVVADSREVTGRTAFAAVHGGRNHIAGALGAGAPFAIVSPPDDFPHTATVIVVDDVVSALGALAADVRSRLDVRVVGITGSTGKTLTKDFLAAALGRGVHATPRSFNAELGVPLVVLSCPDDVKMLVLELAARHPGEIAELCEIVRPGVGLITGIGITHISEFGSREMIARTKSELLASLPASGVAVLPADDDYLPLLADATNARLVTVGPGGHVSFGATSVDTSGVTRGWIRIRGDELALTLPVPGRALVRNAAMSVATAVELGVGPGEAVDRIASATTSSWRMQIVKRGGFVIVNDAWNANPTSTGSALRTVAEMAMGAEKWAVLGGMAELGDAAPAAHARIGRLVRALGFEGLVAVSEAARPIAEAAGDIATMAAAPEEAAEIVDSRAGDGAWVLVKASRVQHMEDFPGLLSVREREDA